MDIWHYRFTETENILTLSDKEVFIPSINDSVKPFETWLNWDRKNYSYRNWWRAYNHVKHNGYNSRKEGNLNNIILSLCGLFVLNCIHMDLWGHLIERDYTKKDPIKADPFFGSHPDV